MYLPENKPLRKPEPRHGKKTEIFGCLDPVVSQKIIIIINYYFFGLHWFEFLLLTIKHSD